MKLKELVSKIIIQEMKRIIKENYDFPKPALKWLQDNKRDNNQRIGFIESPDLNGYREYAARTQKWNPGLTGEMINDLINAGILKTKRFNNKKDTSWGLWITSFTKIPS